MQQKNNVKADLTAEERNGWACNPTLLTRQAASSKEIVMNVENAKSQMRKGMLEYCVLLLLSHEASYANDIITRLKEAELIVVEGTLYPLLTRLKKDGLLAYEWRESTQGPPRKYYELTEEGRIFLNQLDRSWNDLMHTVTLLKGMAPQLPMHNEP